MTSDVASKTSFCGGSGLSGPSLKASAALIQLSALTDVFCGLLSIAASRGLNALLLSDVPPMKPPTLRG